MATRKKKSSLWFKLLPLLALITGIFFSVRTVVTSNPVYHLTNASTVAVDINHERGNLDDYSMVATDNGDLSVKQAAALAGTGYGLSVNIDDNARIYGLKTLPEASLTGVVRARFYFDPNGLHLGNLEQISFIFFSNSLSQNNFAQMKIMNIDGNYHLRGVMIDDNGAHKETKSWLITDAPHYIEIRVKKAASSSSSDASFETWIDGVPQQIMSGVDSFEKFSDFKNVGVGVLNAGGTINGTYYLDEIVVNTDGSAIGPVGVSLSPTLTPTSALPTVSQTATPTQRPTATPTMIPLITPTPTLSALKKVEVVSSLASSTRKYVVFDGVLENGQLFEVNSSRFSYSNGWSTVSGYGVNNSLVKYSSALGSKVTFSTAASRIDIQTAKYLYAGKFDVYVNGVKKATFDGYSATPQFVTFSVNL